MNTNARMKQMLSIATVAAVLSAAPAGAQVLGGNLGGGLAGGLSGIGSANGAGGFGGTLDRPMVIDRVGSATGRVKDTAGNVAGKAHGKLDSTRASAEGRAAGAATATTQAAKDKAAEAPAATVPAATAPAGTTQPSRGLDLGGGLGGEFDSPHASGNGNASGAARANRTDGVSVDGQSSGALRSGPKPAEPAATTP